MEIKNKIKCIICGCNVDKTININGIYIGFCKKHDLKDYEKQHSLMRCIICDKKATKIRNVGGNYVSFCKGCGIKEYNTLRFWG